MTDYKPGTVAAIRCRGDLDEFRAVKDDKGWASLSPEIGWASDLDVVDVRPLVVLDVAQIPSAFTGMYDETGWEYVIKGLREDADGYDRTLNSVADQIEAQTKPPTPAEPERHGAVVEDRNGHYWTLIAPESGVWMNFGNGTRLWDGIDVARVLSEGVQP